MTPRRLANGGLVLGALAAWIALPPLELRSLVFPVVVAAGAAATGIVAIRKGETRRGRLAVAAALFGGCLGVLATFSSVAHLEAVVGWSALLAAMLRYATPLLFAAIGGLFSERSGVVNIGLEGMMLTGAFFGILGDDKTGSWKLGLASGILAGGVMALLYAFWAIHLRVDQIIGGTAVNFIALGLTGYLFIDIYGDHGTPEVASVPAPRNIVSYLPRAASRRWVNTWPRSGSVHSWISSTARNSTSRVSGIASTVQTK